MSYNANRYNLWQPFFKMAENEMATVSNTYTCRPIIILISENQIYILLIFSDMFDCISTVCLNCFKIKESSFCILSFKTE